jgi:hypothetical protein
MAEGLSAGMAKIPLDHSVSIFEDPALLYLFRPTLHAFQFDLFRPGNYRMRESTRFAAESSRSLWLCPVGVTSTGGAFYFI